MKKSNNIVTIIGTRPQIIKLDTEIPQTIIWTGQHYDYEMSQVFFKELKVPKPDYSLNYKSGQRSGQMIDALRKLLRKLQPKLVLVYGDCNTTLSGTLAAAYENIPIAHIEAGLRSFNRSMPEEINRVVVDHLATYRFCPNVEAVQNLFNEGITGHTYMVGDVMFDSMNPFMPLKKRKSNYILLTIHRQENTQERVQNILNALGKVKTKVVWPQHPRIKQFKLKIPKNVKVVKPVGYKEMLTLESNAKHIVTDSGGVMREAYWMQKPVTILRKECEWNGIITTGYGVLADDNEDKILNHIETWTRRNHDQPIFEFGAKKKIRQLLYQYV